MSVSTPEGRRIRASLVRLRASVREIVENFEKNERARVLSIVVKPKTMVIGGVEPVDLTTHHDIYVQVDLPR